MTNNKGLIKEVDITEGDLNLLIRLSGNKDFQRFREISENYLQKSAYELMSQNFQSNEEVEKAVSLSRGGYRFWRQVTRPMDTAPELLKEIEANKKNDNAKE